MGKMEPLVSSNQDGEEEAKELTQKAAEAYAIAE
jgi:hypothetical protein